VADKQLTDPLGRIVTLHNHTWFGHILPGHPEMAKHRPLVEAAVVDPIEIRISDADAANCRLYFGTGPRSGIMIIVVANITMGFVKTAFIVKLAKGALEWSKPTP
jgi:hypothetical protein